jgi:hypothetical protein
MQNFMLNYIFWSGFENVLLQKVILKKPQTDVKSEKLNIRIPGLLISRTIYEYFCNFSQ